LAAVLRRLTLLLAVALCLSGCSAVRIAYNQGTEVAYWWLDDYVDFDHSQSVALRQGLDGWFRWHRHSELPQYAALLARAREQVVGPVTTEQACGWFDDLNARADAAIDQALPVMAEVMRGLDAPQLSHLEHKFAETNEGLADRFLQRQPEARRKAQLERAVDRIEMLYGNLSDAQLERIAQLALDTPFDPERWLAQRRLRQQDTLQTLRRLSAEQASVTQAEAALKLLAQRARHSPDEDYRAYQQRLIRFNCGFVAQVHNLTTPKQRAAAAKRFSGWEEDVRVLAAQAK
jgi:hypothetical protein